MLAVIISLIPRVYISLQFPDTIIILLRLFFCTSDEVIAGKLKQLFQCQGCFYHVDNKSDYKHNDTSSEHTVGGSPSPDNNKCCVENNPHKLNSPETDSTIFQCSVVQSRSPKSSSPSRLVRSLARSVTLLGGFHVGSCCFFSVAALIFAS